MPISIQCDLCSSKFKVPDSVAGKVGKCPKCGNRIAIRSTESPPVVVAPPSENESQPVPQESPAVKQKSLLGKTLTTIITFAVLVAVAKLGGRWLGIQAAKLESTAESQSSGAPDGVFGTTRLMSEAQVKQVIPSAVVSGKDELLELRNVHGRPAKVNYVFQNNMLVGVLITFTGESSRPAYDEIQRILTDQLGPMSSPTKRADGHLASSISKGRINIDHILYSVLGIHTEQIFYYRTKGLKWTPKTGPPDIMQFPPSGRESIRRRGGWARSDS